MAKLKPLSFDTRAWLSDEELSRCSSSTRGIWMDLLCRMHEADRAGELQGTAQELAEKARCSESEFIDAARELKEQQAAQVRFDGVSFFLRNRRMFRYFSRRKSNAERQQRHRELHGSDKVTKEELDFERFWRVFPRGRKKAKANAREAFQKAVCKADVETIIKAASEYAASEVANGRYVKMPQTWLNQECWNDDRESWRDLDKQQDSAYREISAEQFREHFQMGRFKEKPSRHAQNKNWVYGTLRDGTKVECKNYPAPNQ